MSNFNANRRMKDRKKRKKLRDRLEAQGVDPARIEAVINARRQKDHLARQDRRLAHVDLKYDPDNDAGYYPDDSGFEPSPGDPLLRGPARATGMTAKVVKRTHTITRYEYDREVGR